MQVDANLWKLRTSSGSQLLKSNWWKHCWKCCWWNLKPKPVQLVVVQLGEGQRVEDPRRLEVRLEGLSLGELLCEGLM